MSQDLVHHLKRRRGGKNVFVGTLVATAFGPLAAIGFSKCRVTGNDADTFDKTEGINLAMRRAKEVVNNGTDAVPQSIKKDVDNFVKRAQRYYKGKTVVVPR